MEKLAGHPWYATLGPVWSKVFVVFSAAVFYCLILGTGFWIANAQYGDAAPKAWFVIAITLIAAVLWTRIVVGMATALKKAKTQR